MMLKHIKTLPLAQLTSRRQGIATNTYDVTILSQVKS